jgi:large subunit ribosomal protein L29
MRELKIERIREMTEDDILQKIRDIKEELFHLRFRNQMRQLQNPLLLREKRRDVARLETILNEHVKGIRALIAGPGTPGAAAAAPARTAAPPTAKAKAKSAAKKKSAAKRAPARSKPAAKSRSKSATSKKGKKA